MKKYSFPLAAALRARQLQQDVARSELQKANLAADAAQLVAKASLEHYEQVRGGNDADFLAGRQQAGLAAGSLTDARLALAAARAAVDEAMARYLEAAKAVSVLEHLDERRRQEHRLDAQREEATVVDELVVARHALRRKASGGD